MRAQLWGVPDRLSEKTLSTTKKWGRVLGDPENTGAMVPWSGIVSQCQSKDVHGFGMSHGGCQFPKCARRPPHRGRRGRTEFTHASMNRVPHLHAPHESAAVSLPPARAHRWWQGDRNVEERVKHGAGYVPNPDPASYGDERWSRYRWCETRLDGERPTAPEWKPYHTGGTMGFCFPPPKAAFGSKEAELEMRTQFVSYGTHIATNGQAWPVEASGAYDVQSFPHAWKRFFCPISAWRSGLEPTLEAWAMGSGAFWCPRVLGFQYAGPNKGVKAVSGFEASGFAAEGHTAFLDYLAFLESACTAECRSVLGANTNKADLADPSKGWRNDVGWWQLDWKKDNSGTLVDKWIRHIGSEVCITR